VIGESDHIALFNQVSKDRIGGWTGAATLACKEFDHARWFLGLTSNGRTEAKPKYCRRRGKPQDIALLHGRSISSPGYRL
jgi:hypothetical protein